DGSASLYLIPAAQDPRDPSTYVGLLGGGDDIGNVVERVSEEVVMSMEREVMVVE
ncbi:hypothetical protein Tco_0398667, partial [Tanacetum coccineum]